MSDLVEARFSDNCKQHTGHGISALTLVQEDELKFLWEESDTSSVELSKRFGVTKNVIIGIVTRRNWKLRRPLFKTSATLEELNEERQFVAQGISRIDWRKLVWSCPDPGTKFTRTLFSRLQALHDTLDNVIARNPVSYQAMKPKSVSTPSRVW